MTVPQSRAIPPKTPPMMAPIGAPESLVLESPETGWLSFEVSEGGETLDSDDTPWIVEISGSRSVEEELLRVDLSEDSPLDSALDSADVLEAVVDGASEVVVVTAFAVGLTCRCSVPDFAPQAM